MHSRMKDYRVVRRVVLGHKLFEKVLFCREGFQNDVDQLKIEVAKARRAFNGGRLISAAVM